MFFTKTVFGFFFEKAMNFEKKYNKPLAIASMTPPFSEFHFGIFLLQNVEISCMFFVYMQLSSSGLMLKISQKLNNCSSCRANQWTGVYMITASAMKVLKGLWESKTGKVISEKNSILS